MSDTKQAKALTFGNHSLWKLGSLVWFVHTVISEHIMLCTQLQNLVFLIGRCAIYELAQYAVVKDAANYTDTLPEQDMETLETSFHQPITLGQNQVTKNTEESLTIQDSRSGRWRTESSFDITRAICYNTAVPEIWSFRTSNRRTKDNRQTTKRWSKYYSYSDLL